MRIAIIALALVVSTSAFAAKRLDADGNPMPRDTTTIKACGVKWKALKADHTDTNVEIVAKGWPKYWSACAKEAKAARTVAP